MTRKLRIILGPDPDDLLDQGYTDENGDFLLKGDTVELTPIDPVFKVYHDCDDGIKVYNMIFTILQFHISRECRRSKFVNRIFLL